MLATSRLAPYIVAVAVNIAFYTVGDTRLPNSQPLVRGRRLPAPTDAQVPHDTISAMYQAYARRLVRADERVFACLAGTTVTESPCS